MHVMIVSLSGRKSGFDVMGPRLQSAMAALVYNKPFSFSQFFMDEFIQQIHAGGEGTFFIIPSIHNDFDSTPITKPTCPTEPCTCLSNRQETVR